MRNPFTGMSAGLMGTVIGLALLPADGRAQAPALAPAATPPQVLLYPGGAQIERTQRVAGGAHELRFSCLAADIDADSLQVSAGAGIHVGEIRLLPLAPAQREECRGETPREAALEGQRDALLAEQAGLEMVLGYLRNLADKEPKAAPALVATLETVRRQTQDAHVRQAEIRRRLAQLTRQLESTRSESTPLEQPLKAVLVRLAAGQPGEVRLSYRVNAAGWQPQYRAYLDSTAASLRIERLAEVGQSTGEDWRDARLRLSTEQPRRATAPTAPWPWRLNVLPPLEARERSAMSAMAPLPAPAMAPAPVAPSADPALPRFDASVFQGAFAAEYQLPQPMSLRGNGERLTLQLDSQQFPASVYTRLQPASEPQAAYLVAELARPSGSWPDGPVSLYRDGAFVGRGRLALGSLPQVDLFFGRDERLRLRVLPPRLDEGSAGLLGNRRERSLARRYEIENLATRTLAIQVIEPTPVAEHESITVQTQLRPAPAPGRWRDLPGMAAWQLDLAPRQSVQLEADYRISVPKDARISGMP